MTRNLTSLLAEYKQAILQNAAATEHLGHVKAQRALDNDKDMALGAQWLWASVPPAERFRTSPSEETLQELRAYRKWDASTTEAQKRRSEAHGSAQRAQWDTITVLHRIEVRLLQEIQNVTSVHPLLGTFRDASKVYQDCEQESAASKMQLETQRARLEAAIEDANCPFAVVLDLQTRHRELGAQTAVSISRAKSEYESLFKARNVLRHAVVSGALT